MMRKMKQNDQEGNMYNMMRKIQYIYIWKYM